MQHVSLRRRAAAATAAASLALVAFAGPASAAVSPGSNAPSPYLPPKTDPTAQSLIMKDGNVCDPIRHMGC